MGLEVWADRYEQLGLMAGRGLRMRVNRIVITRRQMFPTSKSQTVGLRRRAC